MPYTTIELAKTEYLKMFPNTDTKAKVIADYRNKGVFVYTHGWMCWSESDKPRKVIYNDVFFKNGKIYNKAQDNILGTYQELI